jgi:hypothetical protein
MPSERELVEMADTYRDMAQQAKDPRFKLDFAERAERYETALWAVRRVKREAPPASLKKGEPPK